MRTGKAFTAEYRVLQPDNSVRWVSAQARGTVTADGRTRNFIGVAVDITRRKATEAALHESEERFRLVAESAPVMLWMGDHLGKCVYLNRELREFWGIDESNVSTFDWITTLHPDDRDVLSKPFARGMQTHTGFTVEARYRRASDGAYRLLSTQAQPRFGAGGQFLGMIGVNVDVTETRKADARRGALLELNDRVRDLTDSADVAFAAAEILGRTLGVSRAGYGTIDRTAETISIERDWNAPGIKNLAGVLHFRDYGSYIDDLKRGETVVFADAETDPRTAANADALKAISAQAVVNMPVTEQGNFVALLYLNHATAREWPTDELVFVREVAERTRSIIERRRAEQDLQDLTTSLERQVEERTNELRANVNRLRTTFETSYNYQGYMTRDGTLLDANNASLAGIQCRLKTLSAGRSGTRRGLPARRECPRPFGGRAACSGRTDCPAGPSSEPADRRARLRFCAPAGEERKRRCHRHHSRSGRNHQAHQGRGRSLRQAQKMEAIGQLTGGIAHDFNNMLAVVIGALNLLQRRLAQGEHRCQPIRRCRNATARQRAATLTQRLLAFSRQPAAGARADRCQPAGCRHVASCCAARSASRSRSRRCWPAGLWRTHADPSQLENAILNLAVNARDAMPDGGKLTIETANAHLDEAYARRVPRLPPGQYVLVSRHRHRHRHAPEVMAQGLRAVLHHQGGRQGTGLGLSQVYGFVRQSGGHVKIYSRDRATARRQALSAAATTAKPSPVPPKRPPVAALPRRAERDRPGGRGRGARPRLLDRGPARARLYGRVRGHRARQALRLLDGAAGRHAAVHRRRHAGDDRPEARRSGASQRRPKLKVLFTTGYTRNAIVHNGGARSRHELPAEAVQHRTARGQGAQRAG